MRNLLIINHGYRRICSLPLNDELCLSISSFGRIWCKYYISMDLLTEHDDVDNWYPIHLNFDNYTMFVLPIMHTLPKELNKTFPHLEFRLSISTLLMNHVLDPDIWTIRLIWRPYSFHESICFWYFNFKVFWLWIGWLLIRLP